MPRTSRLPEYQAFIDAKDMLDKEPVDYVKYDKYVLVKREVWEKSVERTKKILEERTQIERAIYEQPN